MGIFTGKGFHRFSLWFIMWLDILDSLVYILSFTTLYIHTGMSARVKVSKFTMNKLIKERNKCRGSKIRL